ncbi:hypothetical protein WL278_05130 [Staphylococcus caprae]|uniref:Phage protein n=1 Tax=Staphylococcus caprae TaxID=29380 RepID=A0ABN5W6B1_9STAP|nr:MULTISPECIES: hypothetical protein [Staphylococcus]EES41100.1 hypothetical protein HMPREF0793_1242 [Staphylococcus caprae M23864:W1]MBN6827087.1 hypothetical protein [Staphylococcus caprae]MBX5316613.1 hypothetical protein [Staphylococcus caprae]MBX5322019.1 hypothetical protein [Staphylococcus caprae]MDI0014878.1 hypothetical protein [Staphylococcus caprae]
MKISNELIETYLSLVNDKNPVHNEIVPGQLVCEIAFSELNIHWDNYKIKYLRPIDIHDDIRFFVEDETKIKVSNNLDGVKLVILRI